MIARYHLSNTADEMTVGGEFTVRKECFETIDDGVEIGEMYHLGRGVPKDEAKAIHL